MTITDLSPAQRRVLALMALGLTNRAIAGALGRTEAGIESEISRIYLRLGANDDRHDQRVTAVLRWLGREGGGSGA